MPPGRSEEYAVWRSCERFNILPPGIESDWEQNSAWAQAMLIAFQQVRSYEEAEVQIAQTEVIATALGAKVKT